jgi:hypothetical protein
MLAYCDYMAKVIKDSLTKDSLVFGSHIGDVGKVQYDLGPNGEFSSTKKTLSVMDRNGKAYRVTIEEMK